MNRYIICNWKCHKTVQDSLAWLEKFSASYSLQRDIQVVICPSSLSLVSMKQKMDELNLAERGISLGAQDVSPFPRGSYTGALSADMLRPYASRVIVGHSERRKYFHETNHEATNKVAELADAGLAPILCLEDSYIYSQLSAIADIDCPEMIVAYTPSYALNSNVAEPVESVIKAVAEIKRHLPKVPVLYGGAVKPENAKKYWDTPSVDGLFVGASSLDVDSFLSIIRQCSL